MLIIWRTPDARKLGLNVSPVWEALANYSFHHHRHHQHYHQWSSSASSSIIRILCIKASWKEIENSKLQFLIRDGRTLCLEDTNTNTDTKEIQIQIKIHIQIQEKTQRQEMKIQNVGSNLCFGLGTLFVWRIPRKQSSLSIHHQDISQLFIFFLHLLSCFFCLRYTKAHF